MSSRANELNEVLEQEIVTGHLRPGERLEETALAERFGVSRTPVRESLRHLASIGLVELRPRRGAVVAQVTLKDLLEIFEVMAELEGMCGRLAARRMTEDERTRLRTLHEACRRDVTNEDPDSYYARNVHFHEAIYDGSHNEFLKEQTRAIRNRVAPYRRLQLRLQNRIGESFEEHEGIVDAIVTGDGELAEARLREHVTVQSGSFNDFVSSLPAEMLREAG